MARRWMLVALPLAVVAVCSQTVGAIPPPTHLPVVGANSVRKVAVFGDDSRMSLPASHRALRNQIGLLYEPRSRIVCTAFCVSDHIIATAGHCLFRTLGEKPLHLPDVLFRVGPNRAQSFSRIAGVETGAAANHVMSGSLRISMRPPIDATQDWALVRLARPICTGGGLKLGRYSPAEVAAFAREGRVYQVAYHRDFGGGDLALGVCGGHRDLALPTLRSLTEDFNEADQVLFHACDTGGASSGSPLLITGASGPEVVGMNVGTYVHSKEVVVHDSTVLRRFKPDYIANTGVLATTLAAKLRLFASASLLADRDSIQTLQTLLLRKGWSPGPLDGLLGPRLRAAIDAYELAEHLPITGLATEQLLRRLEASFSIPRRVARLRPDRPRHIRVVN